MQYSFESYHCFPGHSGYSFLMTQNLVRYSLGRLSVFLDPWIPATLSFLYLVLDGGKLPFDPLVLALQSLHRGEILSQVVILQLFRLLRDPVTHILACTIPTLLIFFQITITSFLFVSWAFLHWIGIVLYSSGSRTKGKFVIILNLKFPVGGH